MKPYEALFILAETVRDENVEAFAEKIRAEIERGGGVIEQTFPLGRRAFAAALKKREGGFYLRVDFQVAPDKLAAIQSRFKMNEDIFRMQIVGVGKERIRAARAAAAASKAGSATPVREA